MRPTNFLLILLSLSAYVLGKKPILLNDKTFEHDTQASTGATTGDWLISFCDRSGINKQNCIAADGVWQKLADSLNHRVSVAQVDL